MPIVFPSARERLPKVFKILDRVIDDLNRIMHDPTMPEPTTVANLLRLAAALKAFNTYKALKLVLEGDHWETGASLTRSIFELLVNMEEVFREETQVEERAHRYLLFSYLQHYLHRRRLAAYALRTGRSPKENRRLIKNLDKVAEKAFATFRYRDKRKRKRWQKSWCNKNIRELAQASSNPMRASQYEILYSFLSAHTHSAPVSVMETLIHLPETGDLAEFQKEQVEKEDEELTRVFLYATGFIVELMQIVGPIFPRLEPAWPLTIMADLSAIYGVEAPPLPPELQEELKRIRASNSEERK